MMAEIIGRAPVILGVCYDKSRLLARLDVFEGTNMVGIPASTKESALQTMELSKIDAMVLCASIPIEDCMELSARFKRMQGGAVVWVRPELIKTPAELVDAMALENSPAEIRQAIMNAISKLPPCK